MASSSSVYSHRPLHHEEQHLRSSNNTPQVMHAQGPSTSEANSKSHHHHQQPPPPHTPSHGYTDQRVLRPLGQGQQEQAQAHGSHHNNDSSYNRQMELIIAGSALVPASKPGGRPGSATSSYNRQMELIRGESSSASMSLSKTGGRPGSATSASAGAGPLAIVPATGVPSVDGGMRGDVSKTKGKTTMALVDAFEVVAYEIGMMRDENSRFKVEKEILEEKVEAQIVELKHIRGALVEMERTQERVRREYEEEISRLKGLLGANSGGPPPPTSAGGMSSLSGGSSNGTSLPPASRRTMDTAYAPPPLMQQSQSGGSLGERDPKRFRTSADMGPVSGRTSRADSNNTQEVYLPAHQLSQVVAGKQPYRGDAPHSHGLPPPTRLLQPQPQVPYPTTTTSLSILPSYSNGWANYQSLAFEDLSLATLPPENRIEGPDWHALCNPDPRLHNGYAILFGGQLRVNRDAKRDANGKLRGEIEGQDANGNEYGWVKPRKKRTLRIDLVHTFVHETVVCCVQFSPDGRFLATGCNRTAQIYEVDTGKTVVILEDKQASPEGDLYIRSIRFSPDGRYLATGAEDRLIRVWHIESRKIIYKFSGHTQEIYSLDYSNDGRFIVSGSGDRTMRIWDVSESVKGDITKSSLGGDTGAGGNKVIWVDEEEHALEARQMNDRGDSEARESGDSPGRGHPNSRSPNGNPNSSKKKRKRSAEGDSSQSNDSGLTSISISPSNRYVAAGSLDSTVRIYSLETGTLVVKLRGHADSVYSVKWAAYTYGADQPMKIFVQNENTGKWEYRRGDMEDDNEFDEKREIVYSGSLDKSVWGWDLTSLLNSQQSPEEARRLERPTQIRAATYVGHKDFVLSVAASPDGAYIISGSKDRCVHFIDTQTGIVEVMLAGHKNSVISLDVARDTRRGRPPPTMGESGRPRPSGLVATGSGDNTARIWSYIQFVH